MTVFSWLQFTYKVDRVQLTFLQLLSKEAYQNITYHCRNSVAYFDHASNGYHKAAKFQTYNDLELSPNRAKFRYSVKLDECQVNIAVFWFSPWTAPVFCCTEFNGPKCDFCLFSVSCSTDRTSGREQFSSSNRKRPRDCQSQT